MEGNVLFNDTLNTLYLRLYSIRHMVKYHTDSERGNPLPPHGLLFPINSKGSFICTIPQTGLHIPQPLLHQSWNTGWNDFIDGYLGPDNLLEDGLVAPCQGLISNTPHTNQTTASFHKGSKISSVVRVFAHDAMGRRIDPSWWTH